MGSDTYSRNWYHDVPDILSFEWFLDLEGADIS